MTPEQFLKKWVEPAARGLKVLPEKLAMKDDLEAVIRSFNDEAGRTIIEEKIGHIDNWGEEMIRRYKKDGSFAESDFEEAIERMAKHHEDDHIEASPFCLPSPIRYGNDFGIKRPDKSDNPTPHLDFANATRKPIGDGYTQITVPLKFDPDASKESVKELRDILKRPDNKIKIDNTPRQALRDILEETDRPDNQLIVDCDYPPETIRKTYPVSGSINKTVKVPEDKFDSLLEALKKCPDKRVEL